MPDRGLVCAAYAGFSHVLSKLRPVLPEDVTNEAISRGVRYRLLLQASHGRHRALAATLRNWGARLLDQSATLTEALRAAIECRQLVTAQQLVFVHGAQVTDAVVCDLLDHCLLGRTLMWDALVAPTHAHESLRRPFPRDSTSSVFAAQCVLDMGRTPHDDRFMFTILRDMKKIHVATPNGKAVTLYVAARDATNLPPSMTAAFRVEG